MASKTTRSRTKTEAATGNGHAAGSHARSRVIESGTAGSDIRRPIDLPPIQQLQILDERGVVDSKLDPNLSAPELLKIHRAMVLTRKLDIRMLNMQRQGEMGTFAPGIGQEATQIGQVYPLESRDWYAPSYRSFGAQLWRGWPIAQLLLLWDGFFEGFAPPEGVNDLPFSIVVGSHLLPAVGVAQGIQYRETPPLSVVLCNFGDGAISQGAVNEAFNFAAVDKAPVIFVCENNGWAISTPVEKQAATETLAQRGVGFGIPSVRVDGNDVLAVIVATRAAVERARSGGGPTLIEALTYRLSLHTTADDPTVYRKSDLVQPWEAKDPIARFEKYLIAKGVIDKAGCERVAEECEQEVLAARDEFRKRAVAKPREVFDFVYEKLTPELEEQQREYFENLKRKGIE
ncbi:MAG: pyruvate dehydrogenase (acetyl-transferring) E1 component subunit alpha [Phycisphaerales bacterium]|nr:pyruvate dehydrogenase (acetyl-transferring) E1 component subunit alpha [Phycisphaerales bacterium]